MPTNDITDLIFRCKEVYLMVPVKNQRYLKMVRDKLAEITIAGTEHEEGFIIDQSTMKGFIHSVAKFEKYVREKE
jgi:hypothetical protein